LKYNNKLHIKKFESFSLKELEKCAILKQQMFNVHITCYSHEYVYSLQVVFYVHANYSILAYEVLALFKKYIRTISCSADNLREDSDIIFTLQIFDGSLSFFFESLSADDVWRIYKKKKLIFFVKNNG